MPSVRSRKTVSRKVASRTSASPRERCRMRDELVPLGHVPGDDGQHGGERRERDVGGERRREQHEERAGKASAACPRPVRARRRARWSRCARSCRSRRSRRTAPRRCWRRPAPRARSSSDAAARSCRRRRRRRAANSMPPRSAMRERVRQHGDDACSSADIGGSAARAARSACRRSACRWSRPAGRKAQPATAASRDGDEEAGPGRPQAPQERG